MKQLKTLKDFVSVEEWECLDKECRKDKIILSKETLIEIAIQYLIHYKKESYRDYHNESGNIMDFIIHFFTITDEELENYSRKKDCKECMYKETCTTFFMFCPFYGKLIVSPISGKVLINCDKK